MRKGQEYNTYRLWHLYKKEFSRRGKGRIHKRLRGDLKTRAVRYMWEVEQRTKMEAKHGIENKIRFLNWPTVRGMLIAPVIDSMQYLKLWRKSSPGSQQKVFHILLFQQKITNKVLVQIWKKGNSFTLLVRKQINRVTMQSCGTFL
jgi:hypothetical protein